MLQWIKTLFKPKANETVIDMSNCYWGHNVDFEINANLNGKCGAYMWTSLQPPAKNTIILKTVRCANDEKRIAGYRILGVKRFSGLNDMYYIQLKYIGLIKK